MTDQNTPSASSVETPISPSPQAAPALAPMTAPGVEPKKRMGVFAANFLIFAIYYFGAILLEMALHNVMGSDGAVTIPILFFGYMVHAGVLIIISVFRAITMRGKDDSNAGRYFLMALLLLIVGFGACSFALSSGLADLNI